MLGPWSCARRCRTWRILSAEFGPEEAEEDAKLRADVDALIATASQEMAAALSGRAVPGPSRVDALQSTVSAELLERVTEESAGSRIWQRRAEAAALWRARGEPVFALLSVLILLPVLAFTRRLREGLRALTAAAGRVAARDASEPVALPEEKELAEVVSAFDSMAASVAQRTAELAGTNDATPEDPGGADRGERHQEPLPLDDVPRDSNAPGRRARHAGALGERAARTRSSASTPRCASSRRRRSSRF